MEVTELLDSVDSLHPSKSEWVGFYKSNGATKILMPKSLKSRNPDDLRNALNGLFFIYQLAKGSSKSKAFMKFIKGEVDIASDSSLLIYCYIGETLRSLHEELGSKNYFQYEKETVNSSLVKGRIDFAKSAVRNGGLKHKHTCTFKVIDFSHPVLFFAKFCFNHFLSVFQSVPSIPSVAMDELNEMATVIDQKFSECRNDLDPIKVALEILSGKHDQNHHFYSIIPECKLLANVYLESTYFFSQHVQIKDKVLPMGIALNLNRAFELILRKAIECFLEDTRSNVELGFKIRHERVTDFAKYLKHGEEYFQMRPDCWFEVNGVTVIIDAKHKIASRSSDDSVDFDKIDRNDLYQITSYAYTHSSTTGKGIYGILALHEESNFDEFESYIKSGYHLQIKDKQITVLSMKLNKFLYDVGYSIQDLNSFGQTDNSKEIANSLFVKLGEELNNALKFF
jgi:5-methylcytosine-specific restriction endonuclease McrBC regulatory subunit McrC